jgi:hypothetical protein
MAIDRKIGIGLLSYFRSLAREPTYKKITIKLKCFCEMFASQARASWLSTRCSRHERIKERADVAV